MSTTPKKERIAPMSTAQRFELMTFVKNANPRTPDRSLAAAASELFDRDISPQTITGYRKEFGIPSVAMPTRDELQAQVDAQADRIHDLLSELARLQTIVAELTPKAA